MSEAELEVLPCPMCKSVEHIRWNSISRFECMDCVGEKICMDSKAAFEEWQSLPRRSW
jgi:hypothetical protein